MKCAELNAWLCGLLDDAAAVEFEEHAASCETCSQALLVDQQMMDTLRVASITLEVPPDRLSLSHQPLLQSSRSTLPDRNRFVGVSVLLSALAVVLAIGACIRFGNETQNNQNMRIAESSNSPQISIRIEADDSKSVSTNQESIVPPEVTIASNHRAFELESADSNVTILMLYPTSSN